MQVILEDKRKVLRKELARLDALSPLAVLNGDIVFVTGKPMVKWLKSADVAPGERLRVTLGRGQLRTRVEAVEEDVMA